MATPWVQSLSPKKGKKERKKRSLKVFDQLYFAKRRWRIQRIKLYDILR
jgi:hypothetical protein